MNIPWKDLGERLLTTFVLAFCGLIVLAGQANLTTAQVALVGALAAVLSLIKNLITTFADASNGATWWQDMALRVMGTYVQTWIGLVLVLAPDGSATSIDFTQAQPALLAAIPAALGVLKGYVASKFGDPATAGFFSNVIQGEVVGSHEVPAAVAAAFPAPVDPAGPADVVPPTGGTQDEATPYPTTPSA